MKKYLVLYHSPVSAREQMAKASQDQSKAGMEAWMKWAETNKNAIVELGMPLEGAAVLTKGANAKDKNPVSGFSILRADSFELLTKVLKEHPHLSMPGGAIELFEFLPMPGM